MSALPVVVPIGGTMKYCEETVIKDGQTQACDRPLDERGYCDRPGDHT